MPMNNRLLVPRQTGHPEAVAWRNAVIANGDTVSGTTLNAVSNWFKAIYAAGVRSLIWRANPFAGDGLLGSLVPVIRGPTFGGTTFGQTTDTNNGPFVSGDYSLTSGLTGNGSSKYLRTGVRITDITGAAGNFHMGVYAMTAGTTGQSFGAFWFHSSDTAQRWQWEVARTGGANTGTTVAASPPASTVPGFFLGCRSSSSSAFTYRNGVAGTENSAASSITAQAIEPIVFGRNLRTGTPPTEGISPGSYSDQRLAGYTIGQNMTAAQALAYSNAWVVLMTAIGRTA